MKLSSNQHKGVIYQGASTTQPCEVEVAHALYYAWPTDKVERAKTYHGQSNSMCGCCGAFQAKNMEEFNTLETTTPTHDTAVLLSNFNRGLMLMVNPDKDAIVHDNRFPVHLVRCGEDTLAIRIRTVP